MGGARRERIATIACGFPHRANSPPVWKAPSRQFVGVCRPNDDLARERSATSGRRHRFGFVAQITEATRLGAEFDRVGTVRVSCREPAARDLDRAFGGVFAGRASFPRSRRRDPERLKVRRRRPRRVARPRARRARRRRDFRRHATFDIAERFGLAVPENPNTRGMTALALGAVSAAGPGVRRKALRNRPFLGGGRHGFVGILPYGMQERDGQVAANPARSTRPARAPFDVVEARRRGSRARFVRVGRGHTSVDGAIGIRRS